MDTYVKGRARVIKRMHKLLQSPKSEFVAMYGRRRVGKTFLIRKTYAQSTVFHLTGIANSGTKVQLNNFARSYRQYTDGTLQQDPSNWFDAFELLLPLLNASTKDKKVIFIDELPWLDTPRSNFVQALEHFWNNNLSTRHDVLLIVCGSAASWMINKLINNKGGLHNRVTARIKLEPFNLNETQDYFEGKASAFTPYNIAQLYMATGGIPYYLDMIDTALSVPQNINAIYFAEGAPMRAEFGLLYNSLFKKAGQHIAIIEVLAQKMMGLTRDDLLQKAGIKNGGGATMLLQELEECGFIRKYNAVGKKQRNQLYQLVDFFSLFHLRFVKNRDKADTTTWTTGFDTPAVKVWAGFAFEMLCMQHIAQVKVKLGISGIHTEVASWYHAGHPDRTQIDLLIDRRDGVINICEMKFSIDAFAIDKQYYDALKKKLSVFRTATATKKSLYLTVITANGLEQNAYAMELVQNKIGLPDLFVPDPQQEED